MIEAHAPNSHLIGFSRALKEDFPPEEGEPITSQSIDVAGFGDFGLPLELD